MKPTYGVAQNPAGSASLSGGEAAALEWRTQTTAEVLATSLIDGSFETGDFTGWTTVNAGNGAWFVYSGTTAPLSGFTIAAPPDGNYAATTDQGGPGSHILYQDVTFAPNHTHTLSFILYYQNDFGVFITPDTLDPFAQPNQQYRVDITDPNAPVDSVTTGVLAQLFRTEVGDPPTLAPTPFSFDLTPFAGQTVRIRFAEVDNQSFFQASVDKVELLSEATKGLNWRSGYESLDV